MPDGEGDFGLRRDLVQEAVLELQHEGYVFVGDAGEEEVEDFRLSYEVEEEVVLRVAGGG